MTGPERYEHVFGEWRGCRAAYWRPFGNVGDRLIDAGARQLFQWFGITETLASTADVVFWAGGGNMGTLYPRAKERRMLAAAVAEEYCLPFVILPQSWNAVDDTPFHKAFVREEPSRRFCPEAIPAADLAMAFRPSWALPPVRREEGWFFRRDAEAAGGRKGKDPAVIARCVRDYVNLAAIYGTIHTDRAHFAAAGLIARRRVILYPNSYHKNAGLAAAWAEFGCEFSPERP